MGRPLNGGWTVGQAPPPNNHGALGPEWRTDDGRPGRRLGWPKKITRGSADHVPEFSDADLRGWHADRQASDRRQGAKAQRLARAAAEAKGNVKSLGHHLGD